MGGKWRVNYRTTSSSGGAGEKILFLRVNGSDVLTSAVNRQDSSRGTLQGSIILSLAAADYIEATVFQNVGASMLFGSTTSDSGFMSSFEIEYLGA
jgi:hypothetical protein